MKQHANTLYITTQKAYLSKDHDTIDIRIDGKSRLQLPIHTVDGIVCFGNISASPFALGLCAEHGKTVSFLTETGRFLARVEGPVSGNVLLRRQQFLAAEDSALAAPVARGFVIGKLANCRTSLLRTLRDHSDKINKDELNRAAAELAATLEHLNNSDDLNDLDILRGIEGQASQIYFGVFDHVITSQKKDFTFTTRTRRPPLDNINALLSFLYMLLAHDCRAACQATGLDEQVGFLHALRPGRPSLALDLMEEFRPLLADRVALSLVNRQQVNAKGFRTTESGAVEMTDNTRKIVLQTYQKRKLETITHPFLNEKMTLGLLPHIQARLLARYLRDDLDAYPPFLWR